MPRRNLVLTTWQKLTCDPAEYDNWEREALRLLARFRKKWAKRSTSRTPSAEELKWFFTWTEDFVPLDLEKTAEERAEARIARSEASLWCSWGDCETSVALASTTQAVDDAILEQEVARRSTSDITWHDDLFEEPADDDGTEFGAEMEAELRGIGERVEAKMPEKISQIRKELRGEDQKE